MSLEKLLAKIGEDARAEGESLLAEAEREAADIKARGEEEARLSAEAIRASFRERGERERTRIMSEALTGSRAAYLSVQEELFEETFEAAEREFKGLPEDRYRDWLKRIILDHAREDVKEVVAAPYDRGILAGGLLDEINAALRERGHARGLSLSGEEAGFERGVILKGERYSDNLSLGSVLREVRERHEEEVLAILFGEGEKRGNGE